MKGKADAKRDDTPRFWPTIPATLIVDTTAALEAAYVLFLIMPIAGIFANGLASRAAPVIKTTVIVWNATCA